MSEVAPFHDTVSVRIITNRRVSVRINQSRYQSRISVSQNQSVSCISQYHKSKLRTPNFWPTCSLPQFVSIISLLFVLLSTLSMVLNTLLSLKHVDQDGNLTDNEPLAMIELASIIWFTMEFLLRALSCPDKVQFVKNGMNIIDVLSILPYYFSLLTRNVQYNWTVQ